MYKILLVTTVKCEGCRLMKDIIREALNNTKKEVKFEIYDWKDLDRKFLTVHHLKDFPTVFYMVNNVVKFKTVGTYPSIVVNRYMDVYFKM